ncbi:hypothetical protein H0H93_015609 [Arthromyces matolae]|nr:hypothetical protein H0H93_015609 [Arthromyces matolae]
MISPPPSPSPVSSSPPQHQRPGERRNFFAERPHDAHKRAIARRADYRRDILGFPTALDEWLADGLRRPIMTTMDDIFLKVSHSPFRIDWVDCEINVMRKEGAIEEPFQDPHEYTLSLTIHIPLYSGFLAFYGTSPTVVLARYTGNEGDIEAPDWIKLQGRKTFSDIRTHAIEILAFYALEEDNKDRAGKILRWCRSVSRTPLQISVDPSSTPKRARPLINARTHKPRASDIADITSQEYRIEHNSSPIKNLRSSEARMLFGVQQFESQ